MVHSVSESAHVVATFTDEAIDQSHLFTWHLSISWQNSGGEIFAGSIDQSLTLDQNGPVVVVCLQDKLNEVSWIQKKMIFGF